MSSPLIRFAMIGCGRMGRHHSDKLKSDGRGEVVVLYDADENTANSLQNEFWPTAKVAPSLNELLACDQVDAAIICTPTAEHYPQSRKCLDRGWHLLCEKPLASNREQILELMALSQTCQQKNQAFSLGYQRRYTSIYRTLRREILSGRWGAVQAITSNNVENWQSTIANTWRDDPAQNPGGFITDAGSHKIDMLFYVTGLSPVEVFARCQKWGSQVEIVASASALLTGDVTVTLDFVGHAQYLGEDLHVHCERADLMLRQDELWIGRDGRRQTMVADEPDSNPVSGLLDVILNGVLDLSPPAAALPVYDLTNAILTSSRLGQVVKVPSL